MRALGARAVFLEAENLALYRAGAVMASNYVVALADMAPSCWCGGRPADQALPALIPLLTSVVHNLRRSACRARSPGRSSAATSPRSSGTCDLEARAPEMLDLYRLLGRDVLRLAREDRCWSRRWRPHRAAVSEGAAAQTGAGVEAAKTDRELRSPGGDQKQSRSRGHEKKALTASPVVA